MMAILFPCLKYTGHGMNKAEYITASWGGLRGALAIALAISVASDDKVP